MSERKCDEVSKLQVGNRPGGGTELEILGDSVEEREFLCTDPLVKPQKVDGNSWLRLIYKCEINQCKVAAISRCANCLNEMKILKQRLYSLTVKQMRSPCTPLR